MKYRLTLLQPERTTTKSGNETVTYTATVTVWAERVKQTGRRSNEVGEHFADYGADFNIRDAHTVAEGWRVQQLGGNLYTVNAIIPNIDRGYNTLVCERVNE
jgi:SPP1 family predicted phage head-tail adaptor